MSEHGAVILCCCDRGVGADEVCQLWAACEIPASIPIDFSFVRGYTMRWPDGSSWTQGPFSTPFEPDNISISASGSVTLSPVSPFQYQGEIIGTFTGGGEQAWMYGSNCWQWFVAVGASNPGPDIPWFPDCSRACENYKWRTVSVSGSVRIRVLVGCAGIPNPSGVGFDVGTQVEVALVEVLSSTMTVVDHLFPEDSYTSNDPPLISFSGAAVAPGCPLDFGTRGAFSESSASEPVQMGAWYGYELTNPPWFEVVCNTCEDAGSGGGLLQCGDRIETRYTDWSVSVG